MRTRATSRTMWLRVRALIVPFSAKKASRLQKATMSARCSRAGLSPPSWRCSRRLSDSRVMAVT
ncbi:hypothetical protein ACXZ65_13760 [Streptomyces aculeolatus]